MPNERRSTIKERGVATSEDDLDRPLDRLKEQGIEPERPT
jgi:hypothetical protein